MIASGVGGAARYVVGERMDRAGMRWTVGRAEALLQLRCVELNGDWEAFFGFAHQRWCARLHQAKTAPEDQSADLAAQSRLRNVD